MCVCGSNLYQLNISLQIFLFIVRFFFLSNLKSNILYIDFCLLSLFNEYLIKYLLYQSVLLRQNQ